MQKKKIILFVVNQAKYLISHRLVIAREAQKSGYEVHIAVPFKDEIELLKKENFQLHKIPISRSGINLFGEIISILSIWRVIIKVNPNLVHLISIKAVIYGGIVTRLHSIPAVMAISGLGYLSSSGKESWVKYFIEPLFRLSLNQKENLVIIQNRSDEKALKLIGALERNQSKLIPGSGVNINKFKFTSIPESTPMILMPSRMLWDKGVGVFVNSAKIVKSQKTSVKFVLAGPYDPDNPSSISMLQLNKWNDSGVIEWWGDRDDMPDVYKKSHIVVFPTNYGEGVPKVLLEASSSGRPIITTNTPGCNDIIIDKVNGLLVSPNDPELLASSIINLLNDRSMMTEMGRIGREMAKDCFDVKHVVKEHLLIYATLTDKDSEIYEKS